MIELSGGGGYATRLLDDFGALLSSTWDRLNCPRDCDTACSACVLATDVYRDADDFDRRSALAFLRPVLARLAHPPEAEKIASDAWLVVAAADAIARTLTAGSSVTLYASRGFDLAALDEPPFA